MIVDVPGIPIRRRNGDLLYTLVDPEDFLLLNEWRWSVLSDRPYVYRSVRGEAASPYNLYMHREIMGLARGDSLVVDHINRDPLDNRRANLRVVTSGQNSQNHPGYARTSRFRGVCWEKRHGGKWCAQVSTGGRNHFIGYFDREEEAAAAAEAARERLMPFAVAQGQGA